MLRRIQQLGTVLVKTVATQVVYVKESRSRVYSYPQLKNKLTVFLYNASFLIRLYRGSRYSIPKNEKRHFTYKLEYTDGVTLYSPIENHFFTRADLEYTGKILPLLSTLNIKKVLDLGANIGTFSIPLAIYFKEISFYCVDINYDNIRAIETTTSKNNLDNVTAIHKACWSETGVEIEISHTNSVSSSVLKSNVSTYDASKFPKYKVISIGLNELSALYGPFDMIKLDIEGSEYEVFSKAYPLLDDVKIFICELHTVKDTVPEASDLYKEILQRFNIIEQFNYTDKSRIELVCINKKAKP